MPLKVLKKVSTRLRTKYAHLKDTVYYQSKEEGEEKVPKGGC